LAGLGLYSHISAPVNGKFGTGERMGSASSVTFHVYRGNVSPLRDGKPIFGPMSKNNTDMTALRTGLPVIRENSLQKIEIEKEKIMRQLLQLQNKWNFSLWRRSDQ